MNITLDLTMRTAQSALPGIYRNGVEVTDALRFARGVNQSLTLRFVTAEFTADTTVTPEAFTRYRLALTRHGQRLSCQDSGVTVYVDADGVTCVHMDHVPCDAPELQDYFAVHQGMEATDAEIPEFPAALVLLGFSTSDATRPGVAAVLPVVIHEVIDHCDITPPPTPSVVFWSAAEVKSAITAALPPLTLSAPVTVSTGTVTLNERQRIYRLTVAAATELVFDTAALNLNGKVCEFELHLTMSAMAPVTFPAAVSWAAGQTPTLNVVGKKYRFKFQSDSTGWIGAVIYGDADEQLIYGVVYDGRTASAYQACQKVLMDPRSGALTAVAEFGRMPCHEFRRCVMDNLATRHVAYYLDAQDSTLKADGTAADLTGADGDVVVEIPIGYWRVDFARDGKVTYLLSDRPFRGATIHPYFYVSPGGATARTQYVGAFQSTLCDATGARIAAMMIQDAAAPVAYSDGYKARSVAGCKPWTNMTQATHRTATANNGGHGVNSLFHQYLLLMMLIEGGSFDTQTTVSTGFSYTRREDYRYTRLSGRANFGNGTGGIMANPTTDAQVCWQTIVVNGVTLYRDISLDSGAYFGWGYGTNIYYTASATPANGSVAYSDAAGTDSGYTTSGYSTIEDSLRVVQFSYRGIENPFGEIWKFEDGIQKYQTVTDGVYSNQGYWWTTDTDKYTDVDQQNAATPTYTHVNHAWPAFGWPKTWDSRSFFPFTIGGSNNAYLCNYFYNDAATGTRCVIRGGGKSGKTVAGAGYVYTISGLNFASPDVGARLSA